MIPKPYLLFLGEAKDDLAIKTAAGINFWRPEWCIGQIRFPNANAKLEISEMTIEEAVEKGAKTFVIGVVNAGGVMPDSWRNVILEAIDSGMDIASGMHSRLSSYKEFADAAKKNNVLLHDLRFNEKKFDTGKGNKRKGKRLLTVGTDCSVGKKYTALAIERALKNKNIDVDFKATGQTGVLIAENGIAIDAIVSDFISGAVEWLSPDNNEDHWDIIEGQGSLLHPSFAGVSLGLLHGSQADAFLVCHEPTRIKMRGVETPIPSIKEIIDLTLSLGSLTNKRIKCVGIALNTSEMKEDPKSLKDKISKEFGLPCLDPIVDNLDPFINIIKKI
tara:strand:+ start:154 stop:1149 length:996 start_codon:yes stop_codon:yes gene_type:complete